MLDTSVLIGASDPRSARRSHQRGLVAELHFGLLAPCAEDERARRGVRLGIIEATFVPLPVTAAIAREWGRLAAAIVERRGKPRRRAMDMLVAATANIYGVPLLSANAAHFALVDDLVDVEPL